MNFITLCNSIDGHRLACNGVWFVGVACGCEELLLINSLDWHRG